MITTVFQEQLEKKLGDHAFKTWFQSLHIEDAGPKGIILWTPNSFYKKKIEQQFLPTLQSIMAEYYPHSSLSILVQQDEATPSTTAQPISQTPPPLPPAPTTLLMGQNIFVNDKFSFDNFIVGPNNSFAHAVAFAVAESPGTSYNPFFLYSKVGLGKTHIMQAIALHIQRHHPHYKIMYLSSEKFTNELITALQNKTIDSFREKYRSIDVLLIDDIQFISGKERTQEEFFHTFNQLYNSNKQIILTADCPPAQIPQLEERLISRFAWGITADIQTPDFETRVAILQKKSENIRTPVPSAVLQFIANHFTSNIRELEGSLIRLIALATFKENPITLEMAQELFSPQLHTPTARITPDNIQKIICDHFDISLSDLKSSKRQQMLVLPRQLAMYLVRELTSYSYPEIGNYFGGKDHTTIMYACEKMKKQISNDPEIAYTVKTLTEKIKG